MADDPRAWVVAGAPGSGKSVLGRALALRRRAALLDQDVLTNPLVRQVALLLGEDPDDVAAPAVQQATRRARYDALLDVAADCLRVGASAVLVAPFTTECRDPAAWGALTGRLAGVRPTLVWVTCPGPELLARLRRRGATRDVRKLRDEGTFLASLTLEPVVPHVYVDSMRPLQEQVEAVLQA